MKKVWIDHAVVSPDGRRVVTGGHYSMAQVWSKRRPEYAWGVIALPEFWLAVLSGGTLILLATRRLRRRRAAPKQEAV